jgi:ribosomal protein S6--L-glutamate ligase
MRRRAAGTEFRSNVHRGGSTESVQLPEEYENTAVRAAQIMGLRVAGVDMLEGEDGPLVMEVNSSPGLEGIEQATGVDIAGKIIDLMAEQAAFDDLDIRQRLTVARGYGVVEITVKPDWQIANKRLCDAGLGERDVTVLNIKRNDLLIPVPHGETEVLPGDHLLCYGKLMVLKEFLAPLEERRKKRVPKKKAKSKALEEKSEA